MKCWYNNHNIHFMKTAYDSRKILLRDINISMIWVLYVYYCKIEKISHCNEIFDSSMTYPDLENSLQGDLKLKN